MDEIKVIAELTGVVRSSALADKLDELDANGNGRTVIESQDDLESMLDLWIGEDNKGTVVTLKLGPED